jgi:hypothetical protein
MFETCLAELKLLKGHLVVPQVLRSLSVTASEQAFSDAFKAFAALRLPGGLTLSLLLSVIEGIRGRRIRIVATDRLVGTSICGLWLPGEKD